MLIKVNERKNSKGVFSPQEVRAQQLPGAVPGMPVIVWDHRNNQYGVLNQGFMAEVCVLAEQLNVLGRVYLPATVTIEAGAAVGDTAEAVITVAENQLWFISRLAVTCPAAGTAGTNGGSANYNIEITHGGASWNYLAAAVTNMGATTAYDLFDPDELGARLRLTAGDTIKLKLTVTVDHDVDKDYVITAYGSIGKRLV
jgi:hypothetical protein